MPESSAAHVHAHSQHLGQRANKAVESSLNRRGRVVGTPSYRLENGMKRVGAWCWKEVRRHSIVSVTAAGVIGIGAATLLGVGELAVGAIVAYTAYNVWGPRGEDPDQAIRELAEGIEHVV